MTLKRGGGVMRSKKVGYGKGLEILFGGFMVAHVFSRKRDSAAVDVCGRHVGLGGGWVDALEMLKFKYCERIKTRDSRHC